MKKTFELNPPQMPNYAFFYKDGALVTVAIIEFTKEEAEEYAELMKQTFLNHWKHKKFNKLNPDGKVNFTTR